jgi:hypothetical protein
MIPYAARRGYGGILMIAWGGRLRLHASGRSCALCRAFWVWRELVV